MKILIEESAIDSIKRMAQELQDQRDELLAALESIAKVAENHPAYMPTASLEDVEYEGGDAAFITADIAWVARKAIARCQESTKVFE